MQLLFYLSVVVTWAHLVVSRPTNWTSQQIHRQLTSDSHLVHFDWKWMIFKCQSNANWQSIFIFFLKLSIHSALYLKNFNDWYLIQFIDQWLLFIIIWHQSEKIFGNSTYIISLKKENWCSLKTYFSSK